MPHFVEHEPSQHGSVPLERLHVRIATPADANSIARIAAEREGGSSRSYLDKTRDTLSAPGFGSESMLWVTAVDNDIAAFAHANHFDPSDWPKTDDAGNRYSAPMGWYLMGIVVAPEFRRKGIGLALTRFRMRWIALRERYAFYFASLKNRASIDLHTQLGFVEQLTPFHFPNVTFTGGTGALFRADLPDMAKHVLP